MWLSSQRMVAKRFSADIDPGKTIAHPCDSIEALVDSSRRCVGYPVGDGDVIATALEREYKLTVEAL